MHPLADITNVGTPALSSVLGDDGVSFLEAYPECLVSSGISAPVNTLVLFRESLTHDKRVRLIDSPNLNYLRGVT